MLQSHILISIKKPSSIGGIFLSESSNSKKESVSSSRRNFIKYGVAGAVGFGVASAIEIPILNNSIVQDNNSIKAKDTQISQLQTQNSNLQNQLNSAQQLQGFLTLNPTEQKTVEAVAETMIPTDSNGPGAKETGVIYFIDRQLAADYGKNADMYMQAPFILPNQTGPITVNGITYSAGSSPARIAAGTSYQYPMKLREYWRNGLTFLDDYTKTAYGNTFANLTADQKTQALKDLWNNKPTNFTGPQPKEFFSEMYNLVMEGFYSDPLYGGNIGMAGWNLLAFPGVNSGTAQGHTPLEEATSSTPIPLPPLSLSQLQKGATM